MAGSTTNYGLSKIGQGDTFAAGDYKHTKADRDVIDFLLWLGAEGHHHKGAVGDVAPTTAASLTATATGGTIPGGNRVYYRWTLVDENDMESSVSPEAYVDLTGAIDAPNAPTTITTESTGGTLTPGIYFYVLTAYDTSNTVETKALNAKSITVPTGTNTNKNIITLPSLPSGATGFNIYRRRPTQAYYYYLDSVDMDVATPPTTYTDDGSVAEDCERGIPTINNTNQTYQIEVELQEQPPSGYTWKLYRSFDQNNWVESYIAHITTLEGATPLVILTYTDTGATAGAGSPPFANNLTQNPSKIALTDAQEVDGQLPMGLTSFPYVHTFHIAGDVAVGEMEEVWVCEFPEVEIVGCRAALGRSSVPASTAVIVDVNKGASSATPTFSTIYTTQANRPRVEVGEQIGDRTRPDVKQLVAGDALSVDVDQAGGGATPTDADLVVNVYMIAYGYPAADSFVSVADGGDGAETGY